MPDCSFPRWPPLALCARSPVSPPSRLLPTAPVLAVLACTSCLAEEWLVQLGPLALEVSDRGVEAVSCRDIFVFGDHHSNRRSSFVNLCWYDRLNASRYRFQADDDCFRRAVRMGVNENADMISLYHCAPTYPWHPAYHPGRTRIWDEVTKPYCLGE